MEFLLNGENVLLIEYFFFHHANKKAVTSGFLFLIGEYFVANVTFLKREGANFSFN